MPTLLAQLVGAGEGAQVANVRGLASGDARTGDVGVRYLEPKASSVCGLKLVVYEALSY